MAQSTMFVFVPVFFVLAGTATCDFIPRGSSSKRLPPALRTKLPHAAQLIVSSELTIYASRQLDKVLPSINNITEVQIHNPCTGLIVAINVLVWLFWQIAVRLEEGNWLAAAMESHWTMSGWKRERLARPHTFLTSGFSHFEQGHLVANLGALILFGFRLEDSLGIRKFVYLYMSSLYGSKYLSLGVFDRGRERASLGASGAISALQSYFCLRFPHAQIAGESCPAPLACIFWYVQEFFQLGKDTGIGHGAHLGGYTFGVIIFLLHDIVGASKQSRRQAIRRLAQVYKKQPR